MSSSSNTESYERQFVNLYRRFARIAVPNKATIDKNGDSYSLVVHYSQRDLDLMENISFKKYYNVNVSKIGIESISCQSEPCDTTLELAVKYSKSRQWKVVVKKNIRENAKFKSFIEIWESDTKIKTLTPEILEKNHGEISLSEDFLAVHWSPNEKYFLYTAEYKSPKSESFFKQSAESATMQEESEVIRGNEYLYKDDWGEGMNGVRHPCIYIVDVEDNFKIRCVEVENFSLADAFWIDNDKIGCVALNEYPYRLGVAMCCMRPSVLYSFDWRKELPKPKILYGEHEESIRSPRKNGKTILFLCSDALSSHSKASKLMCYNIETNHTQVIIDKYSSEVNFVPIYTHYLPINCFTLDGKYMLFHTLMKCRSALCIVDLNNKSLKVMNSPLFATRVMDVRHDLLVLLSSAPNHFPSIYIAKLQTDVELLKFEEVEMNHRHLTDDIDFRIEEMFIEEKGEKFPLHTLLVGPSHKMNVACATVVNPHGGPHLTFLGTFTHMIALFAKIGFKTLLINFRGSTGINEEYVNVLCGNIGEMDVKDVMHCIQHHVEKGDIDMKNIFLFGGSHGGFIVTHLCGQFPDFGFKACATRNPVIDISSMIELTDIPDWCLTEINVRDQSYKFGDFGNVESLTACFLKSPMKYVNNIKTPIFLLLGKYDKRVPKTQSIKYYKVLKTCGVDVKCHVYDDKHDLQQVNVDADAFVDIALWFYKYIDNKYKNDITQEVYDGVCL
ncbi:acylamino-acid-releasing enzyme-like isoform X1 [Leptotrombidium deliense]|uniref:acylaminoacyl-peptidase n=1 Tax=Leptotrombidium deliense TaxID=299467 RepID=A0A443S774_9ACAR|nr:acylamino-acid-releasing enzyme-like isoform X1 [Leptotrombidium deliense]